MSRCPLYRVALSLSILAFVALPASAQRSSPAAALTVVSAAPEGEVASREEANEIRVVFSEPMVTLGRIPSRVTAPFFRVTPAITGTFRWSGTTILIFTPDSKEPLPWATRYDVTIDTTAVAISGRRLLRSYTFSFTTPTVKLVRTDWYRRGGRAAGAMVVLLRFNQPVRPSDAAAHVSARFLPHVWDPPAFDAATAARLKQIDPTSLDRFQAKLALTRTAAASSAPVHLKLTSDWDQKRFPPSPELVAFEAVTSVPPQSHVRIGTDGRLPSRAGTATRGVEDSYTIEAEPALFVDGFLCTSGCTPEHSNPVMFRAPVKADAFAVAARVTDVTNPGAPVEVQHLSKRPQRSHDWDDSTNLTLEDAGFPAQPPARTYEVVINPTLQSRDGQTLGYTWLERVENWHNRAFTSFGDGHGVWEKDGGSLLPFYARNFRNVTQWAQRIDPSQLVPTILRLQEPKEESRRRFAEVPPTTGVERKLGVTPDRIQSHGLDLSKATSAAGTGFVWAAVRNGEPIERAAVSDSGNLRASIVQATNLGITVKDSPQNTLVFVTRLDTGAPVLGARVQLIQRDNKVFWSGMTAADGLAVAPKTPLRTEDWWRFAFVATAEKDGDIAYTASDWHEGIEPWSFGNAFDLSQAEPMLRGSVFSDRGVYRLGEEVHLKAVLRHNTPAGIRLLSEGTRLFVSMLDSQSRVVDERTVAVNGWSSVEWTQTLPADGALGSYSVRAVLERDRPSPRKPEELRPWETPGPESDRYVHHNKAVNGTFLVAAYRRPDFRVDVVLAPNAVLAGDSVKGAITAKYLFGASIGARPAKWRWNRTPVYNAPAAVRETFPSDKWVFIGYPDHTLREPEEVAARDASLTASGTLSVDLTTRQDAGIPYSYTFEGDVEDVSRQHIANRSSVLVHPAPWYVGIKRPGYFVEQKQGLATDIVAVSPAGQGTAGVNVEVTLTQIQWTSVRRAEGNGFYTWDTERKEVPAGSWSVKTSIEPVPLSIAVPNGGYFVLKAVARDGARSSVTETSFYALGEGYTAWARYDHNRIDLVPEKKTYRPGESARIMIQSPWERATALVTMEREGIRWHKPLELTSTQQSIAVPITEADIPNVFVSVLLIKGRSPTAAPPADEGAPTGGPYAIADPSDPGKPSFRLGYVELDVEDRTKRLTVNVSANREEYRPANPAQVRLAVTDHDKRGSQSEVTLWAVDYGVLSLTAYQTPDILRSVYVHKALQVLTTDNRQRIISRRVLTPKGETDGGGGGAEGVPGTVRKDFRVLAFWLGSVVTDKNGHATAEVKLPESLTTYRIMAVAGDRDSRFGSGESEIRVNKPLTLKPTYPRFLAVGDRARFGAVVTSQLVTNEPATVTIRSLDPSILTIEGPATQQVTLASGGSIEARFEASTKAVGRARVQMTVRAGSETDSFEDTIPVEILASAETVAAYGVASESSAHEGLEIPAKVVHGFGGLHIEIASTALAGLGEGARYLVEYPYGCAEQRGSRTLAMVLAADLGNAFSLPGVDHAKIRPDAQQSLKDLERYQCPNGGFAYWPNHCVFTSPYLTSYLLHVFKTGVDLKYQVTPDVLRRGYEYLEGVLAEPPPLNEGWWPTYTAWQAFAVKVLVEGGRNQDSNLTRIYDYRDRMPVFALATLHDALVAKGESSGERSVDLRRRISNAILAEAGAAHVEELDDPYLLWLWNSNVRSTAIALASLVRGGADETQIRPLVRWLLSARKDGRWNNTQENAWALQSLVNYYRKYESSVPDFTASVRLGVEELMQNEFKGRSTQSLTKTLTMPQVIAKSAAGTTLPLTFERRGAGTLFYSARLKYASDQLFHQGLDNGIRIERSYEPFDELGTKPVSRSYAAGDLVRVTLTLQLTKERRYVAVVDPLPAGFEPLESWFATTAAALRPRANENEEQNKNWRAWWERGGFDRVERHDDRVQLFATRLAEGRHEFSYVVRATTAGTFRTAPAHAEEMYQPEIFGRTETVVITVR
ncbi:MAG: alpha-2-macroglobulin family protein [Vicinamibacterales bacterium]